MGSSRPHLQLSANKVCKDQARTSEQRLGGEESCLFCLKKIRPANFPLLIQKSLYARHSSSINYYYTKDLNKFLRETKYREGSRFKELEIQNERAEHLSNYYRLSDFPGLLANQWRYHQFNIDQPRFFEKSLAGVVDAHFCSKRKLQERAIRRMLDLLSDSELENCDLDLHKFMHDRVEIEEKPQAQNDLLKSVFKATKADLQLLVDRQSRLASVRASQFAQNSNNFGQSLSNISASTVKPYLQMGLSEYRKQAQPQRVLKISSKYLGDSSISLLKHMPHGLDDLSVMTVTPPSQAKVGTLSKKPRINTDNLQYPVTPNNNSNYLADVQTNKDIFKRINDAFSKANLSAKQPKVLTASARILIPTPSKLAGTPLNIGLS
jgi:hypothetical protein